MDMGDHQKAFGYFSNYNIDFFFFIAGSNKRNNLESYMNSGKLSRLEERWMPLSKASVDVPNSIYESGIEAVKFSNDSSYHLSQKRNNSLHMPLEDHWHLPQEAKKQSSSSKISFRSMMLSSVKFRDSLKQMGRSKTIKTILEDPHDLKDEQLVQSFRKLLILDGQLPEKHDDYHTLLW